MTTEKVLSRVFAVRAMVDADTPAAAALDALTADLTDDIRRAAAEKSGRGNAAKIIRDVLKRGGSNDNLKYPWTDAQGRQCVCDGFVAFRLQEALPLPERPADAPKPLDLDKVFHADVTRADYFDSLPLPAAADVRALIAADTARLATFKAGKARKAEQATGNYFRWDFGRGRPVVNAKYLLDVLAVFPDAERIYFRRGHDGLVQPMQVVTAYGDGVIMPIRPGDKIQRNADADALASGDFTPDSFAALIAA